MGRGDLRRADSWLALELARVVATLVVVGAATIVLALVEADSRRPSSPTSRSSRSRSWLGPVAATAAVVASYLALNIWFTAPVGTFEVTKSEDFAPLIAFAIAAIVCSPGGGRGRSRPWPPWPSASSRTVLLLADADLAVVSIVYTGLVVVVALLGPVAAAFAVVGSYVALNFWFTPPFESLEINPFEDLLPLIAFAAVAAVSAGTVSRLDWLRRRQAEIEHEMFEARVRARSTRAAPRSCPR